MQNAFTALVQTLVLCLMDAEAVYSSGRSREELANLAHLWATTMEGIEPARIKQAFTIYLRESPRFPTPAQIMAIIPRTSSGTAQQALPDGRDGTYTPGRAELACAAIRGDEEARRKMEAILARAMAQQGHAVAGGAA